MSEEEQRQIKAMALLEAEEAKSALALLRSKADQWIVSHDLVSRMLSLAKREPVTSVIRVKTQTERNMCRLMRTSSGLTTFSLSRNASYKHSVIEHVNRFGLGGNMQMPMYQMILIRVAKLTIWMLVGYVGLLSTSLAAQVSGGTSKPPVVPPPPPLPIQVKKTIVFLETDCLEDLDADLKTLTRDQIAKMPIQQQFLVAQQLLSAITQLQNIKQSASKLTDDESTHLIQQRAPANAINADLPGEVIWRLQALKKMIDLTDEDFATLTTEQLSLFPKKPWRGTGFLVGLVDPRINREQGDASPRSFSYLVTNRHVVQPGIEDAKPCRVLMSFIILNRKPDSTHGSIYAETTRIDKLLSWVMPDDLSVDLAAAPLSFPPQLYDHEVIPSDQFVTDEDINNHRVVEGDPVMYAGLFVQTFDQVHTLEPIVRAGTLAMIPNGLIPTPLQKRQGHVFLAEAHVFGGNSGSPILVDVNKFSGILGFNYKLLGVISGEVYENSDLTMSVTTTIGANIAANSDVSIVVPSTEILKLLDHPMLHGAREEYIAHQPPAATTK